jgi:hypothetical protein
MSNYLVWRDHGEVEPSVVGAELDENEDDDRMDEMLADIGREYEVGSEEQRQPPEVQIFYRLLGGCGTTWCTFVGQVERPLCSSVPHGRQT